MSIKDGKFSNEYRLALNEAHNGFCAINGCLNRIEEHHHIIPNTVVNRKKWPLLVCSPINQFPICREHHASGNRPKMRYEVADVIEEYLQKLKNGEYNTNE